MKGKRSGKTRNATFGRKMNRREAISKIGAVAAGAAVAVVASGAVGYLTGLSQVGEPREIEKTITQTVTSTVTAAPPLGTVRIGILEPLTGPSARYGTDARNVINLIVGEEKWNVIRTIPAKVEVIWADTQGKPEVARAEAERLITDQKVHILFGTILSATTLTAAEAAERFGIPFICEASSSPKLTRLGRKWFFRVGPHDELFIKDMFTWLKEAQLKTGIKVKTMVVLHINDLFGVTAKDTALEFNKDPNLGGYEILDIIGYPTDITDASDIALRIKSLNPDVLFQVSQPADAILTQKAIVANKIKPKIHMVVDAGHITTDFIKAIGKDANYMVSRDVFSLDLKKAKSQEVAKRFRDKYGFDLDGVSARVYDAFRATLMGLEKAASTEPEKIRQAFVTLSVHPEDIIDAWEGIRFIPHDKFDGGQNELAKGIIVQFFDDRYYLVWPPELAVREYVFPQPG